MNNSEEFGYFSKTVAERLGVATDTLRSWSLKLESYGIAFERNDRKQRIYHEKDIRVLENMKELMALQQPLDDVAKTIANKIKKGLYIKPEVENNAEIPLSVIDENNTPNTLTIENMKEMMRQVASAAVEAKFQSMQNQLLPSPEEERRKRFDEMMLHRRIERRLQERARQEWDKLPVSERIIKTGLFGLKRTENAQEMVRFINNYVNENYENELKKELDIDPR